MTQKSDIHDLVISLVVLAVGLVEIWFRWRTLDFTNVDFSGVRQATSDFTDPRLILSAYVAMFLYVSVAALMAVAAGLARKHPEISLALSWVVLLVTAGARMDYLAVELACIYVIFACARWGNRRLRIAAAVSIPLAAIVGLFHLRYQLMVYISVTEALDHAVDSFWAGTWVVPVLVVSAAAAAPWGFGLAARSAAESRERAKEATLHELEAQRISAVAAERAQVAALARDVHDVVGHSLAVILAQAQNAQRDPRLADTALANIVAMARRSLQETRAVLSQTKDGPTERPLNLFQESQLLELINGVRSGGIDVDLQAVGSVVPLPPDLETTAYRVLQEALTNAIKHGDTTEPVVVSLTWSDALEIVVVNQIAEVGADSHASGTGIQSIRRRVASVGGRVDQAEADEARSFHLQVTLPIRYQGVRGE